MILIYFYVMNRVLSFRKSWILEILFRIKLYLNLSFKFVKI